jgi:membrane protein YdbS with pleckstrin-like domain
VTPPPKKPPIIYRRSTILFLIFVAAGVLTIPLIWQSPAFSRPEKTFWSIVAAAYTTLAIVLFFVFLVMIYRNTMGQLGTMY